MSKVKWVKKPLPLIDGGVCYIGSSSHQIPERFRELNRSAAEKTGRAVMSVDLLLEQVADSLHALDDPALEPPAETETEREAFELLLEYEHLTPDAFCMQPAVSREVLLHLLWLHKGKVIADQEEATVGLARHKGGWKTSEMKADSKAVNAAKTRALFEALLKQGQTRKQAILSLIERGHGSNSKIERHLSLTNGKNT
jgi:hypothetical protein